MKKIFFTACIAVLAIGCSKTEVNYGPDQQIAFAPVAKNATKAAVAAGNTPTASLRVSAFAGESTVTTASECTDPYFNDVVFTNSGSGVYTASNCYWPNVKKLSFAAVTNTAGVSGLSFYGDSDNVIKLTYTQQPKEEATNDLMWFPKTQPAKKGDGDIEISMNHACAWLSFNIKGNSNNNGWTIKSVAIEGLAESGTVELSSTAVWKTTTGSENYPVFSGTQSLSTTVWNPSETGILVIPQTPTYLLVSYTYTPQSGITITENARVSLEYNGTAKWAAGTKYTYDVTIGAEAIQIKPTAGTWTPGTGSLDKTM